MAISKSQFTREEVAKGYQEETAVTIKTLRDAIEASSADTETTAKLNKDLDKLEKISADYAQGVYDTQQKQLEHRLKLEEERAAEDREVRLSEQRTRRFLSFFNKDVIAILIGGILLIMFASALIFAPFYASADLFETVFLILLGFFFGQGASRLSVPQNEPPSQRPQ